MVSLFESSDANSTSTEIGSDYQYFYSDDNGVIDFNQRYYGFIRMTFNKYNGKITYYDQSEPQQRLNLVVSP